VVCQFICYRIDKSPHKASSNYNSQSKLLQTLLSSHSSHYISKETKTPQMALISKILNRIYLHKFPKLNSCFCHFLCLCYCLIETNGFRAFSHRKNSVPNSTVQILVLWVFHVLHESYPEICLRKCSASSLWATYLNSQLLVIRNIKTIQPISSFSFVLRIITEASSLVLIVLQFWVIPFSNTAKLTK
jgi:hypothetical protein